MESWGSLAWCFGGRVAPSPTCSTWNTSATGLEGGATRTRLPLISRGSLGAGRFRGLRLAAAASLTGRASLQAEQQSGSLVEVNALARRRHHRSLSRARGGARETQVAQPEDTGAACGQEPRGVHSTHGARARLQDAGTARRQRAGGASRGAEACTHSASDSACGATHEAAATRASTCHATPGSGHHSAVADAAPGSPLGGSDGTDADVAERNLVTVPGDRLVEDDPDRRVSLALRASVGFRDMTDERAALGNGSPILGPGGLRGARVDRVSRLASPRIHGLREHRIHGRVAGECRAVVARVRGPRRADVVLRLGS